MDPTVTASVIIIVGAPILSSMDVSFLFVGHIFTRLLLLAYLLYAVSNGPMSGLLAFLAVFTLLLERNQEIITKFPYQAPGRLTSGALLSEAASASAAGLGGSVPPLQPTNTVKVYDEPANKEKADATDLHDNNPRLAEGPKSKDAVSFYTNKGILSASY
jgi:hypothetical protein